MHRFGIFCLNTYSFNQTQERRKETLNKVQLIGRLGRDPETKYSKDGKAITSFSIATTLGWKGKNNGEKKETTEWHRIVTFNKLAEICSQHLSKGNLVYIEGRLHTRSWEQDGATRYITEVLASDMHSLNAKTSGDKAKEHHADNPTPPPAESYPMDDDIPF
mgnify:CR=1 FL=1